VSKPLTATMVACIDDARDAGGELIRYQGGYWAPRGAGHPLTTRTPYFGTPTIHAIVTRGYAEYSEHQDRRAGGTFPIAIRLLPESLA
jgi:hypothetical protein